jgi:hypothetical protein
MGVLACEVNNTRTLTSVVENGKREKGTSTY